MTVQLKEEQIIELKDKIGLLKEQYKKLLVYAYKHRNKYGRMMYIFTSDSYNEARKRNKYLQHLSDAQLKQFLVILQNQQLIKEQITTIEKEKKYIAKKLGIQLEELEEIINRPAKWFWDYPNDEKKLGFIYDTYRKIFKKEKLASF